MKIYSKFVFISFLLAASSLLSACAGMFVDDSGGGGDRSPASEYDRGYNPPSDQDASDSDSTPNQQMDRSHHFEGGRAELEDGRIKQAIDARDVVLGMTRSQVIQSWGSPWSREVAGDGSGGHERWHYGSVHSLNGEKIVVFENGQVAGWYH